MLRKAGLMLVSIAAFTFATGGVASAQAVQVPSPPPTTNTWCVGPVCVSNVVCPILPIVCV